MNLPPVLTPVLIEIATLGIFFAVLLIYRHAKQRFNHRRLPFQGDALRAPGEALRVKYEDLKADFGMYMAMVIVMPLLVYANYIQTKVTEASVSATPSVILMLAAVAFFTWRSVQQLRRITRLRIGYAGEVAVGEQLNQLMLQGYRVFHDVPGDKAFNVDHVVVGPAGVFAVETKTRTKKESRDGKADYKVTFDGKKLSFDCDKGRYNTRFLEQTRRNADWLSALLTKATAETIPVKGVLVLPGWFVNRTGRADVLVMNHREVRTLPKSGDGRIVAPGPGPAHRLSARAALPQCPIDAEGYAEGKGSFLLTPSSLHFLHRTRHAKPPAAGCESATARSIQAPPDVERYFVWTITFRAAGAHGYGYGQEPWCE